MTLSNKHITKLNTMLNENQITFESLCESIQDLRNLLDRKTCLCYKDCHDMVINIDSKINKLIFINCNNINISTSGLITGIEIKKCNDINVTVKEGIPLNNITIENSFDVNVIFSEQFTSSTCFDINKCRRVRLTNHMNKIIIIDDFII
jgi:hypothetical protein